MTRPLPSRGVLGTGVPGTGAFGAVVVGGGPAGLTAAIALAGAQVPTALIAGRPRPADNRTTALLASSVTALETLAVWQRCRAQAAPLRVMRIIDDTGRLLRAPEVRFEAAEIGLEAFGYNIENRNLIAAMAERAREIAALEVIAQDAVDISISADAVSITLDDGGRVVATLAVAADGSRSPCRKAAGIETEGWSYPQTALTLTLRHSRPHHDISTEFHRPNGPFTLVPLPGLRSSLVFVTDPDDAARVGALPDGELAAEIERRAHSILGKIELEPERGVFPLKVERARSLGARRVALVGEAAHVIPPIGAQGLNLGLRDAATIGELVAPAHRAGDDPGAEDLISRYVEMRRADVTSRTLAVDLLNRSLLSDFLPLQGARGLALTLLQQIGPLRRAAMREGIAPSSAQPRLMRGEAL
jgi:2-octaprenyl-6-methoxyphenol hydroxylase